LTDFIDFELKYGNNLLSQNHSFNTSVTNQVLFRNYRSPAITTRGQHWKYPLVISILSKETECSIATAKKRNNIQDGWMLLWLRNNLLWPQLSLQGMPHLNNWTICFLIKTNIESHLSNTSTLNLSTQSAQYEPH